MRLIEHSHLLEVRACRWYAVEHAEKLELAHQRHDIGAREPAEPRRVQVKRNRRVSHDCREHLALQGEFFVVYQRLLYLLRAPQLRKSAHFVNVFVDSLNAAVLGEQPYRRLIAHARQTWDVVRLIPFQRLDFSHMLRTQAIVAFAHAGDVISPRALPAGVEQHAHRRRHELQYVAVAGENQRVQMCRFRLRAQCAEQVVRFIARHLEHRHAERFHKLPHAVELRAQFRRRRRTVRLVFRKCRVPMRRRGHIEGNDAMSRLPLFDSAQEHVQKAVHTRYHLARALHRKRVADRVVRPMHKRVPVDKNQQRAAFGFQQRRGSCGSRHNSSPSPFLRVLWPVL